MTQRVTSTFFPSLVYDDAPAAIAWLCEVFGFERRLVVPGPDGSVRHSELSFGEGVVMVASPRPEERWLSARTLGGTSHVLSVYVEDPRAHHDRVVAAGATILQPLRSEDYGATGYSVADLEGNPWYFADYRPGAWWDAAEDPGACEG